MQFDQRANQDQDSANPNSLVDSGALHSFVKHDVVVKTRCTTAAAPILSVTLANDNTFVSDSLAHLDLTAAVGAGTAYSMPGVPCHVLP